MCKIKRYFSLIGAVLILFLGSISGAKGISESDSLFEMSFEDLMKVQVTTGNIIGMSLDKIPASVTIINSDQIENSLNRNLYDIIEEFVPGAIWMNHYDSPHLGIRGIISDRNYKVLLLVNGRNMNLKARNGATSELENWDLSDIQRIEVIRGPGSVTYGPGAVAGVINIITKNPTSQEGFKASVQYATEYNSRGANISYSNQSEDFGIYTFASIVGTSGYKDINAFNARANNEAGYIGKGATAGDVKISDYFYDYNNNPQLKFFVDLKYQGNWNFWARYTRTGTTNYGLIQKYSPLLGYDSTGNYILGTPDNIAQVRNEHLTFALNNTTTIAKDLDIESMISWDAESNSRRFEYFEGWAIANPPSSKIQLELADKNSLRNKYNNFGEYELLTRFLFKKTFNRDIKACLGVEYSYNRWGAPLFDSRRNIRMGDKNNIISGTDSYIYDPNTADSLYRSVSNSNGIFVGDGWSTNTFSILGEVNYELFNELSMLISGRIDKDSYTKYLFSPRIAFISDIDKDNTLRLVIQQSQRMNTAEELLLQHLAGKQSDPETLRGIELIYTRIHSENLLFNASAFYNTIQVISWNDPDRSTRLTGDLSLYGVEAEAKLSIGIIDATINHSYTKQLSWQLANGIQASGISFSDYSFEYDTTANRSNLKKMYGTGNDLNNWSNNTTKAIINLKFMDGIFMLNADASLFWGFQGYKDNLQMIENSITGKTDSVSNIIRSSLNIIKSKDYGGANFRLNMSITYSPTKYMSITAGAMNLLGTGSNKRYTYTAGNKNENNVFLFGFVEEPRMFMLRLITRL